MPSRKAIYDSLSNRPLLQRIASILMLFRVRESLVELFPVDSRMRNVITVLVANKFPVFLDYPTHPRPRFGHGLANHTQLEEIIGARRSNYQSLLQSFVGYADSLARIKKSVPDDDLSPQWLQDMLPPLDAVSLYAILSTANPRHYFEIGSGNSTRFARRAIEDQGLRTRITSFDPFPRREVDQLCDDIFRTAVEDQDLAIFDTLDVGDVLFIDNSHCAFMNSDVTVCFLEIMPRLKPGVIVHVHDVFLPQDYPPAWSKRWYAEQYLLGASLLARDSLYEIHLPNNFVHFDTTLSQVLQPIWDRCGLSPEEVQGGPGGTGPSGFWMVKRALV